MKTYIIHLPAIRILIFLMCTAPLVAENASVPVWPCYHGLDRDNISHEEGLLESWPEGGPPLLWTASGIGHGYSSVAVTADRIFTAGTIDDRTHVTALDMTGRILWQKVNGRSWQASERQSWAVSYAGARATPTVDGDTVYHLSELGRLTAFDVETGRERWHREVVQDLKADRPKYGLCESVLIQGNGVFCCPGGKEGYVVSVDKNSGKTQWTNAAIDDPVGYCSPVPATIDGVEQIITLSADRAFAFDPNDGRILWQYPFGNARNNNATDPVVQDGRVYLSSGYGRGSALIRPRLQPDGGFQVEEIWTGDLLDNHHGGVLLHDGYLYGAGHNERGWFCLDFKTGQKQWRADGKGSLTYADGRLYCLDEHGTLTLVKAQPDGWNPVGSFQVPRGGRGMYWAHPVVCSGRLYIRHSDKLFCYDIRRK